MKNHRINRTKTVFITMSTAMISLGICLFLRSRLGSDAITIFVDGLRSSLGLTMGNATLLNNGVMLFLAMIFARKFIHFGTVIVAIGTGLFINFFDPMIVSLFGEDPSLLLRLVMMVFGQIILTAGVAFNLSTRFGFGTTDALLVRLVEKYRLKYKNVKILSDITYAAVGFLLGGVIGIGSVFSVITGGPLISWFEKNFFDRLAQRFQIHEPVLQYVEE